MKNKGIRIRGFYNADVRRQFDKARRENKRNMLECEQRIIEDYWDNVDSGRPASMERLIEIKKQLSTIDEEFRWLRFIDYCNTACWRYCA